MVRTEGKAVTRMAGIESPSERAWAMRSMPS